MPVWVLVPLGAGLRSCKRCAIPGQSETKIFSKWLKPPVVTIHQRYRRTDNVRRQYRYQFHGKNKICSKMQSLRFRSIAWRMWYTGIYLPAGWRTGRWCKANGKHRGCMRREMTSPTRCLRHVLDWADPSPADAKYYMHMAAINDMTSTSRSSKHVQQKRAYKTREDVGPVSISCAVVRLAIRARPLHCATQT